MKTTLLLICVGIIALFSQTVASSQILMFSCEGELCVIMNEKTGVLFFRDGTPIAFVEHNTLWSFEGRYLGWLHGDYIVDRYGRYVGFWGVGEHAKNVLPKTFKANLNKFKKKDYNTINYAFFEDEWCGDQLDLYFIREVFTR